MKNYIVPLLLFTSIFGCIRKNRHPVALPDILVYHDFDTLNRLLFSDIVKYKNRSKICVVIDPTIGSSRYYFYNEQTKRNDVAFEKYLYRIKIVKVEDSALFTYINRTNRKYDIHNVMYPVYMLNVDDVLTPNDKQYRLPDSLLQSDFYIVNAERGDIIDKK